MLKFKFRWTLEERQAATGYWFILPWIIGFVFLFAKPMVDSIFYSFNEIKFGPGGLVQTYVGWSNYKYAFRGDVDYIRLLVQSLQNLGYDVPIITVFSLFVAIILNQKFHGRTFARTIFFLPVIIASGAVILALRNQGGMTTSLTATDTLYLYQSFRIQEILYDMGINEQLILYFSEVITRIFDTTWKSGVQILLFLAGLQSISSSYYEAAQMEGATGWEMFWKITFPLISPITLVCVVYTIIDSFVNVDNPVITAVYAAFTDLKIHYSATLSWIYTVIVFIIVGIVVGLISKKVVYMED